MPNHGISGGIGLYLQALPGRPLHLKCLLPVGASACVPQLAASRDCVASPWHKGKVPNRHWQENSAWGRRPLHPQGRPCSHFSRLLPASVHPSLLGLAISHGAPPSVASHSWKEGCSSVLAASEGISDESQACSTTILASHKYSQGPGRSSPRRLRTSFRTSFIRQASRPKAIARHKWGQTSLI